MKSCVALDASYKARQDSRDCFKEWSLSRISQTFSKLVFWLCKPTTVILFSNNVVDVSSFSIRNDRIPWLTIKKFATLQAVAVDHVLSDQETWTPAILRPSLHSRGNIPSLPYRPISCQIATAESDSANLSKEAGLYKLGEMKTQLPESQLFWKMAQKEAINYTRIVIESKGIENRRILRPHSKSSTSRASGLGDFEIEHLDEVDSQHVQM